eukprot:GHRQ01024650.1.p1 GENE.GHRQ01024650.1~~GHRQ01024650.1.p1  ORF type:complete len:117 (-),score=8.42 GHRQ01024650.1:300-650(-)
MDRVLDRAFNRAHGTVHNVVSSAQARSDSKQQQKSREDQLRSLTTPMTADDVVERIDTAFKDGDYYRFAAWHLPLQLCMLGCKMQLAPVIICSRRLHGFSEFDELTPAREHPSGLS